MGIWNVYIPSATGLPKLGDSVDETTGEQFSVISVSECPSTENQSPKVFSVWRIRYSQVIQKYKNYFDCKVLYSFICFPIECVHIIKLMFLFILNKFKFSSALRSEKKSRNQYLATAEIDDVINDTYTNFSFFHSFSQIFS